MPKISCGDILLKVDTRACALDTRHHVMLVLGLEEKYLRVAHMTFKFSVQGEPGKLVIEHLTMGKDLTLIPFAWPEAQKEMIKIIVEQAVASNKFILSRNRIEEQQQAIAPYRPETAMDSPRHCIELIKNFQQMLSFTPHPICVTEITCHEWVV